MKKIPLMSWILLFMLLTGFPSLGFSGEIKLMIPKFEARKSGISGTYYGHLHKAYTSGDRVYSEESLSEFVKEFEDEQYEVERIELWIEGIQESGNITRLFLSLEEKGGCKVVLKPQSRSE